MLTLAAALLLASSPASFRSNPRWRIAKPLERAHLTALQSYRLTTDVGCAVQSVLTKLRESKDDAVIAELKSYEQAWAEIGSKQYPDPAIDELNKKFPRMALALETEALTFRDLLFTLAQVKLGASLVAGLKPGTKPPFPNDVTGAGEYLFNYGEGLQACGLWKPKAP